ncbi:MAG TPA: ASCH domain-containing protein [Armatimonadota bacterium]|jgi:hypothetical protein
MFAINFYSQIYVDMLRKGRKTATIRLGDKSHKYVAGMLVWITTGRRFGPRQKLFTAIIDDVRVCPISDLTPREIERESPEVRSQDDLIKLLEMIYSDDLTPADLVTVVHFSQVID